MITEGPITEEEYRAHYEKLLENEDLRAAVFTALGGVSDCWGNLDGAGVFDSTRARMIGDLLMERIEAELKKAKGRPYVVAKLSEREREIW